MKLKILRNLLRDNILLPSLRAKRSNLINLFLCLSFLLTYQAIVRAEDKKVDNDMSVLEDEPVAEKKEPAWKELLKRLDQKMEEARKKKSQQPVGGTTNAMAVRGKEKVSTQGQSPQERLRFKGVRNAAQKPDAPKAEAPKANAPEDTEMKDLESAMSTVKMGDSKKSEAAIGDFEKKYPASAWKNDLEAIQKSLQEEK